MPGFTSRDNIIYNNTVLGQQESYGFYKVGAATTVVAGNWYSLWTSAGQPGVGTNVSGATISNVGSQTAGAIWVNDQAAAYKFLVSFGATSTQPITLMLYDRLSVSATQALTPVGNRALTAALSSPNRYNGGTGQAPAVNNQVWLEVTTAITGTGTVTAQNYTAADGTTNAGSAVPLPALAVTGMVRLALNASKRGITSMGTGTVAASALSTATITAGVANVVLIRPIATISLATNQWNEISLLDDTMGLPRVYDGATLGLAYQAGSTVGPTVQGYLNMVWG
jgi:hypothetical protein